MDGHKRIFYFDVLRVISIIGIIFCHSAISFIAVDIGSINFYIAAFMDCFREFSVPIFVMLSGALLIGKNDSISTFFKRRLTRIFIPFIFWWAIYSLYSFFYVQYSIDWEYAFNIFIGKGGTIGVAFWFIWMIIVVYIAIFIINKIISYGNSRMKNFDKRFINLLTVLSVAFIIIFQMFLLPDAFYKSLLGYYASFISYAIIGYFLTSNDFISSKISANKLIIITLTLSLTTYIYYIFYCVAPMSISNNSFTYFSYFNVLILVMSASIFLLFKNMSKLQFFKKIEKSKYGEEIIFLSRYSYGIYLAHYLIMFIIKKEIIKYYDFSHQSPLIWMPLLVIATLVVSLIVLIILDRIPYINKVTGNR